MNAQYFVPKRKKKETYSGDNELLQPKALVVLQVGSGGTLHLLAM